MVKGLYTAYTGMTNEMKRLDVLANNLANADTTGYKKEGTTSTTFAQEYAIKIKDSSEYGLHKNLGDVYLGTHLGQVYTDWSEGSLKVTDQSTDLAVGGEGFFAISFTDKAGNTSMKLTRDGSFTVNAEGYLVTNDGDYVLNATGALNSEPTEDNYVRIDPNATFSIDQMGYVYQNDEVVATIGLVDVDDYDYIEKYGENMYNVLDGGNITAADGTIIQGALETSNVNVVSEMVNMITIQRAYEAGQKVITSIDSTLDIAANQLGKV
jgi:flagellar basal-body rod protein FlgG